MRNDSQVPSSKFTPSLNLSCECLLRYGYKMNTDFDWKRSVAYDKTTNNALAVSIIYLETPRNISLYDMQPLRADSSMFCSQC